MKPLLARATLAFALFAPLGVWSQITVAIDIAPPPLPLYAQPPVPGEGYIWTPGYWVWSASDADYYWVPGTWVLAPNDGDLWTPGYWAFEGAGYFWHGGYWGRSVGYYGGLNYGHGYTGSGYQGGRWDHGAFRYNRAASNVGHVDVHNAYSTPVLNRGSTSHASFHRGASDVRGLGTPVPGREVPAQSAGPTEEKQRHEHAALAAPTQRASISHGVPPVAATPRPSAFTEPGIERARAAAPARAPAARPEQPRPESPPRMQAQRSTPPQRQERPEPEARGERPHQDEPRR